MKKILYVAAAAMFLIAGCKGNGATQPAENAPAQAVGSSDIAFVQVEAVLAQSDLFQSEGAALQEKTKKAQEGWARGSAICNRRLHSCRRSIRRD